ncbi:MAG: hypothetical protein WKF96_14520 [Solirubrobacteraceae bacterium]
MGSLGTSLVAWLGLPLVLYLGSFGAGLLTERLVGWRVPDALLAPVGFCVAIVALLPGYRLGVGAWLAAALFVAVALAGLVSGRRGLRRRLDPGWVGVAGLGVYILYMVPVLAAGGWTWTGYNFVNDTAVQFVLAEHLADHGTVAPLGPPGAPPQSTGLEFVRGYLGTGYPLGIHSLLAALDALIPAPLPAIYQPLIASSAAFAAMALAGLARGAGLPGLPAAVAGAAAMASNLTYNYGLQGNAKETAFVAALAAAAGAGAEALSARRPVRAVAVVGLCLAAAISLFSAAALPYALALALALLLACFLHADSPLRRRLLLAALAGTAIVTVASLATLVDIFRFGEVAVGGFGNRAANPAPELAHLVDPLPRVQAAGVWLSPGGDYRYPVPGLWGTVNAALIAVMAVALVVGVLWLLRRRQPGPLLPLFATGLALVIVAPRVTPYAAAKTLAIVGPAVILGAAFGFVAAARWLPRLRLVAYAAAAALLLGIVVSDIFTYRSMKLAPIERLQALAEASEHVPARDRALYMIDDSEDFAKYFAEGRENVALGPVTAAVRGGRPAPVERPSNPLVPRVPYHADLDHMLLDYVTSFRSIVQRRGPTASRPPAGFELVFANRWYAVWSRRPGVRVLEHLPVQPLDSRGARVSCSLVADLVRAAEPGDRVTAARGPEVILFDTLAAAAGLWPPDPLTPGSVKPETPGTADRTLDFGGGRYRVWVRADLGRRVDVALDGRRVASARGINTAGAWLPAATVRIDAGRHRVALSRPGRSLRPGDSYVGVLGPLAFERVEPARLLQASPDEAAARFCNQRLDWVELTRKPPALSSGLQQSPSLEVLDAR